MHSVVWKLYLLVFYLLGINGINVAISIQVQYTTDIRYPIFRFQVSLWKPNFYVQAL